MYIEFLSRILFCEGGCLILFAVAFAAILAVIFINGFTDAANAIATAVGSKAIQMRHACILSAFMNFTKK